MKFIDEAIIFIKSGNGGNGCISFKRKKKLIGPDGGNGGNGGNVWFITDKNINTLNEYKYKKHFFAENGNNGKKNNRTGKNGKDIYIKVPIGTRIIDLKNKNILLDMKYSTQKFKIIQGGIHGIGNNKSKSSINKLLKNNTLGQKGITKEIKLELILLADVGMIGLPNSGKSTFVKSISSAKVKIANYPFSTLNPILGVVKINNNNNFIITDLPGIIKGASKGYGLGLRFLKHIKRCKILLHLVDILPINNTNPIHNISIILKELKNYNINIKKKNIWTIFNKSDLLKSNEAKKLAYKYAKTLNLNNKYYLISSITKTGIKKLILDLMNFINKNHKKKYFVN